MSGGEKRASRPTALLGALAIGALLLAAALASHDLGRASLWYDEGNSQVQAARPLADIARHSARDIHPPGYYWLLAGARALLGESEFALRLPSAAMSVLAAACLIAAGGRLQARAAGIGAALLFAANSFALDYAQQARMYAMHALWGSAILLAALAWQQRPTRRRLLALALLNAAGLWTQYSFAFALLAQGVYLLLANLRDWRRWRGRLLILYTLTALLYLPWLGPAYRSVSGWPNTGEAAELAPALRELARWFSVGSAGEYAPPFAAAIALSAAAAALAWRWRWPQRPAAERALLLWWLVPLALFLLLGLYRPANIKFLLPAQAAFALWLALGYGRVWQWRRWLALLLATPLAAGLAYGVADYYARGQFQRADYRAALADIQRESADPPAATAVILNAPGQQEVFAYYDARLAPPLSEWAEIQQLPRGDDSETVAEIRRLLAGNQRIYALFWGEAERDPQRIVERTLASEGYFVDARWYGDLRLARYAAAPAGDFTPHPAEFVNPANGEMLTLLGYALPQPSAWMAGQWLPLELRWHNDAGRPYHLRYRIFAQLLYSDGRLAVTGDHEPGGNLQPTTVWGGETVVIDRRALALPDALPPGEYRLSVGVYPHGQPAQRLRHGDEDRLILATITIGDGR